MDTLLRPFLFEQPRWVQLMTQACFYGVLCHISDSLEENSVKDTMSARAYCMRADVQFETWPTDALEEFVQQVFVFFTLDEKSLTLDRLDEIYAEAEDVFRNYVPVDLLIFIYMATGESITAEKWKELWVALAFQPAPIPAGYQTYHARTRRVHGRRAITPIRRHKRFRAITYHKRTGPLPTIVKEQ